MLYNDMTVTESYTSGMILAAFGFTETGRDDNTSIYECTIATVCNFPNCFKKFVYQSKSIKVSINFSKTEEEINWVIVFIDAS